MDLYTDEENRIWQSELEVRPVESNRTHRHNIARLETAIEYLSLARGANERGLPMETERYIVKAEECIQRTLGTSPLTTLTTKEAIEVQSKTIGEHTNYDQLGKVVAERTRQGIRG